MFKLSSYNYFVPDKERIIYFNGITSHSFSVNPKEHERLKVLLEDLISFELNYNSIFLQLVKWGFIIDEDTDEVDILRYRNKKAVIEDRSYMMIINPTLECNFNCWYCFENHPKGSMDKTTMEKLKKHIKYKVEQDHIPLLHIAWFGGEPLLYFNEIVYPISYYAKEICTLNNIPFYCSTTTNASKINDEMIEKMDIIQLYYFQITLDGSQERHDKIRNEKGTPSFNKIMTNINKLCKRLKNTSITLRINYDEKTLKDETLKKAFESIPPEYRHLIKPNFQRVWQTIKANPEKNDRRMELYNYCSHLGFKTINPSNGFQIGDYYKCYADRYHHIEINYDGKIYFCTARDYSDQYVAGELEDNGQIKWDESKRIKRYAKATFENEMCLACKYLPLCMGPCSQKIAETPKDKLQNICFLNITEISPETVIKDFYHKKIETLKKQNKELV